MKNVTTVCIFATVFLAGMSLPGCDKKEESPTGNKKIALDTAAEFEDELAGLVERASTLIPAAEAGDPVVAWDGLSMNSDKALVAPLFGALADDDRIYQVSVMPQRSEADGRMVFLHDRNSTTETGREYTADVAGHETSLRVGKAVDNDSGDEVEVVTMEQVRDYGGGSLLTVRMTVRQE